MLLLILCNILFVVLIDKIRGHPTPEEQSPLLQTDKYVGDGGQSFEQARDLDGSVKELRLWFFYVQKHLHKMPVAQWVMG